MTAFRTRPDNLASVGLFLLWFLGAPALGGQDGGSPESFAIRTVLVSVTDADGTPLEGLKDEDFEVEEMGVPRDVVDIKNGAKQEIFLLVDTSAGFRGEIPSLRNAIEAFAAALKEPHEVLLADFGGQVHHLAGPTSDPAVLVRAAGRMTGGIEATYLLDAIAYVCSGVVAMQTADAEPPVVAIITALTPDASPTPLEEVYELVRQSGASLYVIFYDPPDRAIHFDRRALMENFLATLAELSGGRFTKVLAAPRLSNESNELGAELMQPSYGVSFLTEVEPRSTLEGLSVRVVHEGAQVLPLRLLSLEQIVTSDESEEPTQ